MTTKCNISAELIPVLGGGEGGEDTNKIEL